jgi:glycosyltransferase involved in cell wall biosynthesis
VLEGDPDCALLVAGRGELDEALRRQAEELGIEKRVHFLGFRADMPQVLQTLDCFVFPSLREGLGLALVEAMASGLPVVASRVGGIPEVFSEEPMGDLVPPGDEEALAAAMTRMVRMPEEGRAGMGMNARRRAVGRFRAERMRAEYEALYEACLRERDASRARL